MSLISQDTLLNYTASPSKFSLKTVFKMFTFSSNEFLRDFRVDILSSILQRPLHQTVRAHKTTGCANEIQTFLKKK